MYSTLHYLFNDTEPLTSSPSLLNNFFYDDHFTHLYQEGLKKLRSKEDEIYHNSLLKALQELNSIPDNRSKPQNNTNGQFYEKNVQWQDMRDQKLIEGKEARLRSEEEKVELEKRKLILNSNTSINLPYDYIGPIKGWDRRFQEFVKKKTTLIEKNKQNFKPIINENSRKLACYNTNPPDEKVEDRLLRKGEKVKSQKETYRQQYDLLRDLANENPKTLKKTPQEVKDFVEKLYNNAKISRENREILIKNYETLYPFQPKINKHPNNVNRKPLYFLDIKEEKVKLENPKTKKKPLDKGIWDSFLIRNQTTLENKKKTIENSKKELIDLEIKECSFKPEINSKTIKLLIQSNKMEKDLLVRQNFFQNKHKETKELLKAKDKESFEKTCTFKPKISTSLDRTKIMTSSPEKEKNPKKTYKTIKGQNMTPHFKKTRSAYSEERKDMKEIKKKALEDFEKIEAEIQSLLI